MRSHSELFDKLTNSSYNGYQIIPAALKAALLAAASPLDYQACADLLREVNDAQFDIVSNYDRETGCWVRDATSSLPLSKRISHSAPIIQANNALLRGLSRLRAIDFVLQKKAETETNPKIKALYIHQREILRINFAGWCENLLGFTNKPEHSSKSFLRACRKQETQFNNILLSVLYDANLTKDCSSKKDGQELLARYRKLSALLTPTRTLVMLSYDTLAKMVIRETHYPVTTKTDRQKKAIQELKTCLLYPFDDRMSAHTKVKFAMQEADALFADLMLRDDTLLPATARKDQITGLKNAFLVKVEVCHKDIDTTSEAWFRTKNIADVDNTLWIVRMATPVYHGSAESEASILEHTRNNIEQLEAFCAKKIPSPPYAPNTTRRLHICSLNTAISLQNEDQIIRYLQLAQYRHERKNYSLSYLPCNEFGTFHKLELDPSLVKRAPRLSYSRTLSRKADRLDQIVEVIGEISIQSGELPVIQCFGGVDRTVTILYAFLQQWLAKHYGTAEIRNIPNTLARGGNPAEMASYLNPGAPGMLAVSKSNNPVGKKTFSSAIEREYYRASSKERKKNRVSNCHYLKFPSNLQRIEYVFNLALFEEALRDSPATDLVVVGSELLQRVKAIGGKDGGEVSSSQLVDLNLLLRVGGGAIKNPDDVQNSEQMFALAAKLNRESTSKTWKSLAEICLTLVCVSLIVVGALSFIPSGGMSLALTVIGSVGLAAVSAKTAYSVVRENHHLSGSFLNHKERSVARQFSLFSKTAYAQSDVEESTEDSQLIIF